MHVCRTPQQITFNEPWGEEDKKKARQRGLRRWDTGANEPPDGCRSWTLRQWLLLRCGWICLRKTNSGKKQTKQQINSSRASTKVCVFGVNVHFYTEAFKPHAILYSDLNVCGSVNVNVCVQSSHCACMAACVCVRVCVCVKESLGLKEDPYYSTMCWQNAAILQTEPVLGWPRYCSSSMSIAYFAWLRIQPECHIGLGSSVYLE